MKYAFFITAWVAALSASNEYSETLPETITCAVIAITCFIMAAWVHIKE